MIALKFGKDMNTLVKLAVPSEDNSPRKKQRSAGKGITKKAGKVNLAKNLVVTTPTVATETDVNEIVVVGYSETKPLVCESDCMKVYKSRNASHSMSKLKKKSFE